MTTRISKGIRSRVFQGDVFRNIEMIEYAEESEGYLEISKIVFPLAVVLTQDCDLESDFRHRFNRKMKNTNSDQDKWLISMLMAPLYNVEQVYLGEHLSELGMKMQRINANRTPGNYLRNNQLPRYHFISFPSSIPIVDSVVDFKHYFTVNCKYLHRIRKSNFVCRLASLYRECLSQRFSDFLSRIGLPD